jgi:hypothetical protein
MWIRLPCVVVSKLSSTLSPRSLSYVEVCKIQDTSKRFVLYLLTSPLPSSPLTFYFASSLIYWQCVSVLTSMMWWLENEVYWNNYGCERNMNGNWQVTSLQCLTPSSHSLSLTDISSPSSLSSSRSRVLPMLYALGCKMWMTVPPSVLLMQTIENQLQLKWEREYMYEREAGCLDM